MFRIGENIEGLAAQFGSDAMPRLEVRYLMVWRSEESGYLCMKESNRRAWLRNHTTSQVLSGNEVEYRTHCMYPPESEYVCTRDEAAYMTILHFRGEYRNLHCDLRR